MPSANGAPTLTPALTYADLVDLALPAELVTRAEIRRATRLKPEQAPDVPAGKARLYVEAVTTALLVGPDLGESIRFLADVPLDAKGRVPKLTRTQVLVLARTVAGRPGELQLVAGDAMLPWSADTETRLRSVLTALLAPDAPARVLSLREALHVPGNLAGEGETQLFFATEGERPIALSILRRPGEPTRWGVSFSEIVDQAATPPALDTLAWYRLACSLPQSLSERANISATANDRRIATEDYALVLADLGPCTRNRPGAH
ncbi:hypothetical protein [Novosphingobium sp.]|uniref:hypothetical protein n=1 Tax=Novosphingobium sp. TaxID=1874826 RepID=UPI0038BD9B96